MALLRTRLLVTVTAAVALGVSLVGAGPLVAPSTAAPGRPAQLRVGSVGLHRCQLHTSEPAWCGTVKVPLDPTDDSAGSIGIGFGWVPAAEAGKQDGKKNGPTLVAQEGGPGYPSTGTAPDFEEMFGSLLRHRDLLVVDARGTGRSSAIDCEPLQSLPSPSSGFRAAANACGRQLNHTYPRAGGGWVHASDLFTTANSARDLARVLHALDLGKVDLYGDSYGTYFAQSFMSRYPDLLQAVVLDSAYEARDLDPWYRTTVSTARSAFDTVCERTADCPTGSSWGRISRLAAALRRQPVHGSAVGTDSRRHPVTVDLTALVNVVNDAGYDPDPYRQLDAAARAYLEHGDAAALLRLYAQDVGYDYSDYSARARSYSDGLYLAVACTDYPQLFDMRSAPAARRRELQTSIRQLPADTFAPFSTREWLTVLPYTETYTGCLGWPRPTHAPDPPVPAGQPIDPGHVPVLVLNGELDSLTPAPGGAHITRQIGADATHVVAANTVHLVALDNPHPCGAGLVRAFFSAPRADQDTSCAAEIPAIRAVTDYPSSLAAARPAQGQAPRRLRQLAAIVSAEAQDAVIRYDYVDGDRDLGLYGGRILYTHAGADARLDRVGWTADTTITGHLHTAAGRTTGEVSVRDGHGSPTTFRLRFAGGGPVRVSSGRYRMGSPSPTTS